MISGREYGDSGSALIERARGIKILKFFGRILYDARIMCYFSYTYKYIFYSAIFLQLLIVSIDIPYFNNINDPKKESLIRYIAAGRLFIFYDIGVYLNFVIFILLSLFTCFFIKLCLQAEKKKFIPTHYLYTIFLLLQYFFPLFLLPLAECFSLAIYQAYSKPNLLGILSLVSSSISILYVFFFLLLNSLFLEQADLNVADFYIYDDSAGIFVHINRFLIFMHKFSSVRCMIITTGVLMLMSILLFFMRVRKFVHVSRFTLILEYSPLVVYMVMYPIVTIKDSYYNLFDTRFISYTIVLIAIYIFLLFSCALPLSFYYNSSIERMKLMYLRNAFLDDVRNSESIIRVVARHSAPFQPLIRIMNSGRDYPTSYMIEVIRYVTMRSDCHESALEKLKEIFNRKNSMHQYALIYLFRKRLKGYMSSETLSERRKSHLKHISTSFYHYQVLFWKYKKINKTLNMLFIAIKLAYYYFECSQYIHSLINMYPYSKNLRSAYSKFSLLADGNTEDSLQNNENISRPQTNPLIFPATRGILDEATETDSDNSLCMNDRDESVNFVHKDPNTEIRKENKVWFSVNMAESSFPALFYFLDVFVLFIFLVFVVIALSRKCLLIDLVVENLRDGFETYTKKVYDIFASSIFPHCFTHAYKNAKMYNFDDAESSLFFFNFDADKPQIYVNSSNYTNIVTELLSMINYFNVTLPQISSMFLKMTNYLNNRTRNEDFLTVVDSVLTNDENSNFFSLVNASYLSDIDYSHAQAQKILNDYDDPFSLQLMIIILIVLFIITSIFKFLYIYFCILHRLSNNSVYLERIDFLSSEERFQKMISSEPSSSWDGINNTEFNMIVYDDECLPVDMYFVLLVTSIPYICISFVVFSGCFLVYINYRYITTNYEYQCGIFEKAKLISDMLIVMNNFYNNPVSSNHLLSEVLHLVNSSDTHISQILREEICYKTSYIRVNSCDEVEVISNELCSSPYNAIENVSTSINHLKNADDIINIIINILPPMAEFTRASLDYYIEQSSVSLSSNNNTNILVCLILLTFNCFVVAFISIRLDRIVKKGIMSLFHFPHDYLNSSSFQEDYSPPNTLTFYINSKDQLIYDVVFDRLNKSSYNLSDIMSKCFSDMYKKPENIVYEEDSDMYKKSENIVYKEDSDMYKKFENLVYKEDNGTRSYYRYIFKGNNKGNNDISRYFLIKKEKIDLCQDYIFGMDRSFNDGYIKGDVEKDEFNGFIVYLLTNNEYDIKKILECWKYFTDLSNIILTFRVLYFYSGYFAVFCQVKDDNELLNSFVKGLFIPKFSGKILCFPYIGKIDMSTSKFYNFPFLKIDGESKEHLFEHIENPNVGVYEKSGLLHLYPLKSEEKLTMLSLFCYFFLIMFENILDIACYRI